MSLLLGSMVSIAISPSGVARAQSTSLDAQRSLVVKLRIHRAGQSDETAAALFVGKDQRNAYFITAYHAIGPNSQGVPVSSVQLQFFTPPQKFDASILDNFDEGLDLGVVQMGIANLPQGLPQIVKANVAVETPVYIIGHPSAGNWSVWSGHIQNENAANSDVHHFITNRDESLAGGYSGGPAFDSQGRFLGMHTSTTTSYGIAVKSSDIVVQLAAWHVPANNFTTVVHDPEDGTLPPLQQDRDAINRVLDKYVDSYNRKDAGALWSVWPNAPAQTKHAIEGYFRNARSITRRITERSIDLKNASATVTGQCLDDFTPKNGSTMRSNDSITLELAKKDGNWLIISVK
jgi:S1-C subfamily serine protease